MQGGDDVEEFRLDGFGVRQELDIVDEQHADVQVAAAEVVLLAVPGRDRELAAEFRGAYVADVQRWVQLLRVVADGMQQVGPAQAETALDEQRVACRAGGFGYGDRGSARETVVLAEGECLEGVPRYERAGHKPTIGLRTSLYPCAAMAWATRQLTPIRAISLRITSYASRLSHLQPP